MSRVIRFVPPLADFDAVKCRMYATFPLFTFSGWSRRGSVLTGTMDTGRTRWRVTATLAAASMKEIQ